jgi:hypothetical protein
MPVFYFDVQDGDSLTLDQVGTELIDHNVARQEATRALSEIAAEEIPRDGPRREFGIIVRDDQRSVVLELRLTFHAQSY